MAETHGKRVQDKADVGAARGVIGDEEYRPFEIREMIAAADVRMAEEERGGPSERVIDEKTKEPHGEALRPARIDVVGAAGRGLHEEFLNVGEGFGIGELRFV